MSERDAEARIDAALAARVIATGQQQAFAQLVRRHQGRVRAQLRRLVGGDDAAADDLAQETFLLAWRKLEQFRGDARFSTWLYRIAFSCFLQAYRRQLERAGVAETLDAEAEEIESSQAEPAMKLDLDRSLRRLPMRERVVLLHCYQLGLSHEEAAYVLDLPLGTVKTHAARGKARLRQWLSVWSEA